MSVISVILGLSAIQLLRSFFEDDNSKIVSKQGRRILFDKKEMEDLNKVLLDATNRSEDIII